MSAPRSSHSPHFLKDVTTDWNTQLLPTAIAVILAVVGAMAYALMNKRSKYPLANPPRWFQTTLSKRIEYLKDGRRVFEEAKRRYGDKPYRLITESGECLILSSDSAFRMRAERKLSFSALIDIDFHSHLPGFSPYAMLGHEKMLVQNVIKKYITKSINEITAILSTETTFAVNHIFGESSEWKDSIITDDILTLVARMSSRVFLGEELCRNDEWLRVTKSYTVETFVASLQLTVCPGALKFMLPWFSKKCKTIRGLYNEAKAIIEPVIERRRQIKAEAERNSEPVPVFSDAIEWAEVESRGTPYDARDFQLVLSFAAIHTTTGLIAQAMMRLANEPHLISLLRQEIVEVLKTDGLTNAAFSKMQLMDSALKETQRIKPNGLISARRLALDNLVTPDGIEVKKGERIYVDTTNMIDPKVYPEPEKFDIYRFYKMRQDPDTANKAQLVVSSIDHLAFGHGVHTCPGRFFAANEAKLALCHLLLNYDWELSPDASLETLYVAGTFTSMNANNKVRFRHRKAELDLDNMI